MQTARWWQTGVIELGVVNLMDALRQSLSAERKGGGRSKGAARRSHHRTTKKASRTTARHRKAS